MVLKRWPKRLQMGLNDSFTNERDYFLLIMPKSLFMFYMYKEPYPNLDISYFQHTFNGKVRAGETLIECH